MYEVSANMQELVAYELMSANDAPERDPMDWYDLLMSLTVFFAFKYHVPFMMVLRYAYVR